MIKRYKFKKKVYPFFFLLPRGSVKVVSERGDIFLTVPFGVTLRRNQALKDLRLPIVFVGSVWICVMTLPFFYDYYDYYYLFIDLTSEERYLIYI